MTKRTKERTEREENGRYGIILSIKPIERTNQ
jgi:hypothetical protein